MLICNIIIFLVSVLTGFARLNNYTLGIEIVVLAFFFSMFSVYGNRASSVGTSALLVMILIMDKSLPPNEILPYSLTIMAGGIWYMLLSIAFFTIRPYRAAQQALGENMLSVAKFVRTKTNFYLPGTDIDENYRKMVSQQILISQGQDAVREQLFKSRLVVKESTNASRVLIITFVDLVDMFDEIMATHYDYNAIRQRFEKTGILNDIAQLLLALADEMENAGFAIHANSAYRKPINLIPQLEKLKARIDEIAQTA